MTLKPTAVPSKFSEAVYNNVKDNLLGGGLVIPSLVATTFNYLHCNNEVIAAFALRVGECTELLGVT